MNTNLALYGELTPWYLLIDSTSDHEDEAAFFRDAFTNAVGARAHAPGVARRTLLDLGSGAGNNAHYLQHDFACTLTDISPQMLEISRKLNPDCEHHLGDMRTLRLGKTFDCVLAHDAIVYMTTEADLRAAIQTAFVHTRPGGAALFTPDCVADTFVENTELHQGSDGTRDLRCLAWNWDPDPSDTSYRTEYSFLLRENGEVRAVLDTHVSGLFTRATWLRLFAEVGFEEARALRRPIEDGATDEVFLCRRP